MKRFWLIFISVFVLLAVVFFALTPIGRTTWNNWFAAVDKADDNTAYENLKLVEDTCRAMISSYTADRLTYEQYCNSAKAEEVEWSNQAKMRANKTAATYNSYVLKNSFVWHDNVPADICLELEYLE